MSFIGWVFTIIIAISIILFSYILYSDFGGVSSLILGIFSGFFVGMMVSVSLFLLTSLVLDTNASKIEVVDYEVKLYALQDNMGTHGSFLLGSGSINSELKYYYAVKDGERIKIESMNNDYDVSLVEEDNVNPRIVYYKYEYANKLIRKMGFEPLDSRKEIHIPKGTLKLDMNIDLK